MSISYIPEKGIFVAVGKELNSFIGSYNQHCRQCRIDIHWHYDMEGSFFFTRHESALWDEEFASKCDATALAEIQRRKQSKQAPITGITYHEGIFTATGGGENAHEELSLLGWQSAKGGMACADPFIVHITKKQKLLDDAARSALLQWRQEFERRIAASRAVTSDATFPAPQGQVFLPFQRAGIELCLAAGDKILGDEMGLGKTIMAIGIANALRAQRVLVVCPASLKINWKQEIDTWKTENVPATILEKKARVAPMGFVIVNYEMLTQIHKILDLTWDVLIFDEAHFLKNEKSQRTQIVFGESIDQAKNRFSKALARSLSKPLKERNFVIMEALLRRPKEEVEQYVETRCLPTATQVANALGQSAVEAMTTLGQARGLVAAKTLFISGTPIPNRPVELLTILQKVDSQGLGRRKDWFLSRYCDGQWNDFSHGWEYKGATNTKELGEYLRFTCLIRRLKRDVLKDLPDKTRKVVEILADRPVTQLLLDEISYDARRQEIEQQLIETEFTFHEQIAALKVELVAIEIALATLRRVIGLAKVPSVVDYVDLCFENGAGKVVVMAHHQDVVAQLMKNLEAYRPVKFTGQMGLQARQSSVEKFQSDANCRVFIGSLQAAGVGITLTAAATIIFAEMDWVPGTMRQAEDRCHRIGQHENVFAQYIVYAGSLDAIMCKVMRKKEVVIDSILGDSLTISLNN